MSNQKAATKRTPKKAIGNAATATATVSAKTAGKTPPAARSTSTTKRTTGAPAPAAKPTQPSAQASSLETAPPDSSRPSRPRKATGAFGAKVEGSSKAATNKPEGEVKRPAPAASKLVKRPAEPSKEDRRRWIAIAAYHRAEKRGFAPGYEMQDWLDAEAEINDLIGQAGAE
jgi:hypothetical protein